MKTGNVNENQNPGNENGNETQKNQPQGNEEILKQLKAYQDKLALLEEKIASGNVTSQNDILKLAEAITNKTKKELDYNEGIKEEEIPLDEIMEQGVRFCVPKAGYVITDDKREGLIIKLPYGKKAIFFDYLLTNRKERGKDTVTIPIATYTSKLKKEVEFLRKHTFFNTLIFEDMGHISDIDAERALRLGIVRRMVDGYDLPEIVKQARGMNINFSFNTNPDDMKMQLAVAIVNKEYEDRASASKQQVSDAYKSSLMLQGKA